MRYPPLRYHLERVLRDMGGGISHWAAKDPAFGIPALTLRFSLFFRALLLSFPRISGARQTGKSLVFLRGSLQKKKKKALDFRNSRCQNPFRNLHLRNSSRIQAPLNQTPPIVFFFFHFLCEEFLVFLSVFPLLFQGF